MANVYVRARGDGYAPADYLKALVHPFALLTSSDDDFAIEGIRFLYRGTPEWEKCEDDFRKIVRKICIEKEVEDIMASRSAEDSVIPSSFYALHHRTSVPEYHNKRLVGDRKLKILGEISPDAKRIDFFHSEMPGDMVKRARWERGYKYDGSMGDVLEDFHKHGYSFNLFDCTWAIWMIKDGKQAKQMQEARKVEGAILEDVLRFSGPRP